MTNPIRDPNYRLVTPTPDEIAEYRRKYGGRPRMYRVRCLRCGKRLWYSGLAKGSHEKVCR